MPCLEPVITMEVLEERDRMRGRKVEMPFMTPKRLVSIILNAFMINRRIRGVSIDTHFVKILNVFPPTLKPNASIEHEEINASEPALDALL